MAPPSLRPPLWGPSTGRGTARGSPGSRCWHRAAAGRAVPVLGRAPSGFQLTNARRWLPAEELLLRRRLFTACRGSDTSLPSPLRFPRWPQGSGAAWRPRTAQLHTPEDAAACRGRCPGLPFHEEHPLRRGSCPRGFSHPLHSTGWDAQCGDRVDSQAAPFPLRVLSGCRALAPAASNRLALASPHSRGKGWHWVAPVWCKAPGSRLAPSALAATGATETLRRVGAARSHLPLIEFICYNPKQCKAGFSQAPAACPLKYHLEQQIPPPALI